MEKLVQLNKYLFIKSIVLLNVSPIEQIFVHKDYSPFERLSNRLLVQLIWHYTDIQGVPRNMTVFRTT